MTESASEPPPTARGEDAAKRTVDERHRRITTAPLRATIFWLAMPVVGEQLLNSAISFLDVFLAGNLPNETDAVVGTAAIGLTAYVGWLASMVIMFVGVGTSAMVSRAWGGRRHEAACVITNQSLALAALFSVLASALLAWFAPAFVDFIGLEETTREACIRFMRFDVLGHPAMAVAMIAAAALRGSGDMQTPLRVLVLVNIVNAGVSIWLTRFGPGGPWGADGIVTGTIVARWTWLAIMLGYLASRTSGLRLVGRQIIPRWRLTRRILRIGGPAAMDGLIQWLGHILFLKIIGLLDDASFAAHIAGIRVESLTYLSAGGFGAAAATMIGQNLGARQQQRARSAGHEAVFQAGIVGALVGLLFLVFPHEVMAEMNRDSAVREIGADVLWLISFFQVPLVASLVYVAALRGAGQTRLPLIATLIGTYAIRVPFAYLFAITFGWGLFGAWLAMSMDMVVRAVLAAGLFVFLRWEKTTV